MMSPKSVCVGGLLRHWRPELLQSAKPQRMIQCHGMHFALSAGKLDLYLTHERAVEIEHIFDQKEARKRKI